jgi:hypothetical protein
MLYLQKYMLEKMSAMNTIKSFLGKQVDENASLISEPLIVSARHHREELDQLTKRQVVAYAQKHNISINSRKKKEELIEIIVRS